MVQKQTDLGNVGTFDSGFVCDAQGHIITNNHVVKNTRNITVTFVDGKSYKTHIVGADPFTDIAVIRVQIDFDLKPLPIDDSSQQGYTRRSLQ